MSCSRNVKQCHFPRERKVPAAATSEHLEHHDAHSSRSGICTCSLLYPWRPQAAKWYLVSCSRDNLVLYQSRQETWKIGDFGNTTNKPVRAGAHVRTRGSESYRAPELISEPSLVTHKVDIWALGCILYELLTSKRAFGGDIDVCEYELTLRAPQISIPSCPIDLQAHLSDILEEFLALDFTRRPAAADARCVFDSYKRVPGSRENNFLSLPSYQEWKKFVYNIPDQFNRVCEIAEERQISGDDDGADTVWKDMIQQYFSPSRCLSETPPNISAAGRLTFYRRITNAVIPVRQLIRRRTGPNGSSIRTGRLAGL